MNKKVTPINGIKGIDLRFRHMTDGKGFKRKLDTASMTFISSESVDYTNERGIYDKIPKETIDRFLEKNRKESEKTVMQVAIKSCINSGKLIARNASNGKYRVVHIGEVLSYNYNSKYKTIDLMTVDCSKGYPKNIIYTGQFVKIDDETYINLIGAREKPSISTRGLIEIEV